MTPTNRLLFLIGGAALAASLLLPPAGLAYLGTAQRPPAASHPSAVVSTPSSSLQEISVSLPSSMVSEGYPSNVWVAYGYFESHWKDVVSQSQGGLLYDRSSSMVVTPAMARAGWVLGLEPSQQPPGALEAAASSPRPGATDYVLVARDVLFLPVPKILAGILGAAALIVSLPISRK